MVSMEQLSSCITLSLEVTDFMKSQYQSYKLNSNYNHINATPITIIQTHIYPPSQKPVTKILNNYGDDGRH